LVDVVAGLSLVSQSFDFGIGEGSWAWFEQPSVLGPPCHGVDHDLGALVDEDDDFEQVARRVACQQSGQ
jgi:hypothetical protein